jgi:hypothetical protein
LGTTADASNPFSAKLNAALWTAKTVAEGGTGDLFYTMNKEAAGDDLGLTLQTGFVTKALVGLFGSDRFRLAVSADGSTFFDGLSVDNATGIVDQPRLPRFKAYTNYDNYVGVSPCRATRVAAHAIEWDPDRGRLHHGARRNGRRIETPDTWPPPTRMSETSHSPCQAGAIHTWRDVPESAWRWPNFSPADIACPGTGMLLINVPALDKLQALRDRLGPASTAGRTSVTSSPVAGWTAVKM